MAADGEGTAVFAPSRVAVNTVASYTLTYTVGRSGLPAGAVLKVHFPEIWFYQPVPFVKAVQKDRPDHNHYVTARAKRAGGPAPGVKLDLTIDDARLDGQRGRGVRVFVIKVAEGALRAGDRVTVTFGDTAAGQNLGTTSPYMAESGVIRVASDADGDGKFAEIRRPPAFTVEPGPAEEVTVVGPMVARLGEPVEFRVLLLDRFSNAATGSRARLLWSSSDPQAEFAPRAQALDGRATVRAMFRTPGFQQLRVQALEGARAAARAAAVVKVTESPPPLRLYWGDLHSHSTWSWDGSGAHPFEYARDVSRLDFYANTEHNNDNANGLGITPEEWEDIRAHVRRFYVPGRFVTLLAFESGLGNNFAHHNVFYRDIEQMVYPRRDYDTLQKLWKALEDKRAFTIPHHLGIRFLGGPRVDGIDFFITPVVRWEDLKNQVPGGTAIDWRHRNEGLRRTLEIYSQHGQSELYAPDWALSYENAGRGIAVSVPGPHYARDGWATGQRLAVIASTDNHEGRPGQRHEGLAAVWAPQLTREAVWDALFNRQTYGTTGERMWLEFSADGHASGQEFTASAPPHLRASVAGADRLGLIEIVRYDFGQQKWETIHRVLPEGFAAEVDFTDQGFHNSSLYYLRARQETPVRGLPVWAWSSPVWVNAPPSKSAGTNYLPLALLLGIPLLRRWKRSAASTTLLLCLGLPLHAHNTSTSYSRITILGRRAQVEVTFAAADLAFLKEIDVNHDLLLSPEEVAARKDWIVAQVAGRLTLEGGRYEGGAVRLEKPTDELVVRYALSFEGPVIHSRLTEITGREHLHIVQVDGRQILLDAGHPTAELRGRPGRFLELGVRHIFSGRDHLLFLLALLLGGGTLAGLLRTVTAFTAAHTLTLALATLGMVSLPPRLVEAAIALTIAYTALENLLLPGTSRRWLLAFGFGLVHGFGFAGALQQVQLPRAGLVLSLAMFNAGVEIGQLAALAAALPALLLLRRWTWHPRLSFAACALTFCVGAWWFVIRAVP